MTEYIYTNKTSLKNQRVAGEPRYSTPQKVAFGLSALVAGVLIALSVPYARDAYEMYQEARAQAIENERAFQENHSPLSDFEIIHDRENYVGR